MKQTGPLLDLRGRATGGSHFFALTIPVKLVPFLVVHVQRDYPNLLPYKGTTQISLSLLVLVRWQGEANAALMFV